MQVVTIPSEVTYSNLYVLSGFPAGTSLIVTNNTSSPAFIVQASVPPLAASDQYPLLTGQTVLVHATSDPIWIRGGTGPVLVQSILETITPFLSVDLPHDLYTSNLEKFRRMRVDVGQTGLFEGREFRLVRKVSVAAGTPQIFRFTCAVDFILFQQGLSVSQGDIEYTVFRDTQGTQGGAWVALPVGPIGKNISSSYREYSGLRYVSQATITTGGTFTPTNAEQYVDYDRAKTSGATAQQVSVQGGNDSPRYLGAGTYFLILKSLNGTSVGRFDIAWEERV